MQSQLLETPAILAPFEIIAPTIIVEPFFTTRLGLLYNADCLGILPYILSDSVDTVFADPPFNLAKKYGFMVDDDRPEKDYLIWCTEWLGHCIRVLKPGGALFVYNIPKWNMALGSYLMESGLNFRHWIAINIKSSLPIPGRLYPSHYSLLYFTKGKPKTFRKIRTPIEHCRHCKGEVKDYGGHRKAMNPNGVNLTDVWHDITPVRHWKFKTKKRPANQLSTKLLERVVQMTTREGDVVLDPFGGSGTTFDVCERFERRWIGMEIESCDAIVERLENTELVPHKSEDFVED
jgi:site-specific DNA-methyltransferase (adenine-specific)